MHVEGLGVLMWGRLCMPSVFFTFIMDDYICLFVASSFYLQLFVHDEHLFIAIQGWYSGGFTYGLWLGILVSSGFSVVPVSSRVWKDQFHLARNFSSKVGSIFF